MLLVAAPSPFMTFPNFLSLLFCLAPLAIGCSVLVDLSDTTGGNPRPGAAADAGRIVGAEGGATLDGGVPPDAGRPVYPVGSWCASNASALFFCDDFDDRPLGSRWTATTLQVAGAASLSSANARSPAYGFDIACPALTPSTFLVEVLTESIPPASRFALAFDFNPLMFPAGRGAVVYLATLAQGPGTPRSAIQFRGGTALTDLQEQVILASGAIKSGTGQWESATVVPMDAWTRVEMDVDFTASPAVATLRLNGQTVATGNLDPSWTRAPATLDLGDWYIPTQAAFHVAYDNVTIDVTP